MPAWKTWKRRLGDAYAFTGFRPEATVRGIFGDPKARIIRLRRHSKKRDAVVVDACITAGTTAWCVGCVISPAGTLEYFSNLKFDAFFAGFVAK